MTAEIKGEGKEVGDEREPHLKDIREVGKEVEMRTGSEVRESGGGREAGEVDKSGEADCQSRELQPSTLTSVMDEMITYTAKPSRTGEGGDIVGKNILGRRLRVDASNKKKRENETGSKSLRGGVRKIANSGAGSVGEFAICTVAYHHSGRRLSLSDSKVKPADCVSSKHPLETPWRFWFDKKNLRPQDRDHYLANLHRLHVLNTLKGLLRYLQLFKRPSQMPCLQNLHLFREGSRPIWEDMPNGGCWIISFPKILRSDSQTLPGTRSNGNHTQDGKCCDNPIYAVDCVWEKLLLCCVGEMFVTPHVIGASVSTRIKEDTVALWIDNSRAGCRGECEVDGGGRIKVSSAIVPHARDFVYKKLSEIFKFPNFASIRYKDFADVLAHSTMINSSRKG